MMKKKLLNHSVSTVYSTQLFIYDLCRNVSMCGINPCFNVVHCCYSQVIGFSSPQGLLTLVSVQSVSYNGSDHGGQ